MTRRPDATIEVFTQGAGVGARVVFWDGDGEQVEEVTLRRTLADSAAALAARDALAILLPSQVTQDERVDPCASGIIRALCGLGFRWSP